MKCLKCNSHILDVYDPTAGNYLVYSNHLCQTIHYYKKKEEPMYKCILHNYSGYNPCNQCYADKFNSTLKKEETTPTEPIQISYIEITKPKSYAEAFEKSHEKAVAATLSPDHILLCAAVDGSRGHHQRLIAEVGLKWIATLLKKNADYGSSVFKEPVLAPGMPTTSAIDVRMSDKIARIQNLKTAKAEVTSETIQDTYNDLGSYCLLRAVAEELLKPVPCPQQIIDDSFRKTNDL